MCTAACYRDHFQYRPRVHCRQRGDMRESDVRIVAVARTELAAHHPRIAYQFTGQGSDYAYMMHGLYAHLPRFRELVDSCESIVASHRMRFTLYRGESKKRSCCHTGAHVCRAVLVGQVSSGDWYHTRRHYGT